MTKGDTKPAGSMGPPVDDGPAGMPRNQQGPMKANGDVAEVGNGTPKGESYKVNTGHRVDY